MQHWKNLLPIDQYTVRSNGVLHAFDMKVITYLYQPLIGALACGIYQTLSQELSDIRFVSDTSTHHVLMTRVNLSLKQFYQERKKLEGIGLLKSYQKSIEDVRHYIYELQSPLTPKQFFDDGMLNIYLFNRVGKREYQRMQQLFSVPRIDEGYDDVTVPFNDVFTSIQPSELVTNDETAVILAPPASNQWIDRDETPEVPFNMENFNFDLLFQHLSDVIIPQDAFTKEVRDVIGKLAFIYNLEPQELAHIIQGAFLHDPTINLSKLRKEVQKYYRIEVGHELPALSERKQPLAYQEMKQKQPQSEEEKLIRAFEQMSPYELLEMLADGAKPTAPDLKAIEEIIFEQKLNPGVMNVLIHYVMETNDQKLVKAYMEKIAGQWARKKVKTVRQAMALARTEHRKYQDWREKKQQSQSKRKQGTKRNEREQRLPKWMTQDKQVKLESDDVQQQEKQEWLDNYLKDILGRNKNEIN